jgi:hypothetical protein
MRGELPSQEQTTCSGNSRRSSVSHIVRDFRARARARARINRVDYEHEHHFIEHEND